MRDYQKEFESRVDFIPKILAKSHASGIVFGNFGGKGSALVGVLCNAACENTAGIIIPYTSKRYFTFGKANAQDLSVIERYHLRSAYKCKPVATNEGRQKA